MNILKWLTKRPTAEKTIKTMEEIREQKLHELIVDTDLTKSEQVLYRLAFTQGAQSMMEHLQDVGYL